ncbi:MAG: ABC transporter ATP-binding protein [Propionibacteriaceae bacterium]
MATPVIEIIDLTKAYSKITAVDRLNLTIQQGEIVALLGPNGAGKSTTVEMILGLTKPTSGTVKVFGKDPIAAVRQGDIGVMLQNGALLSDVNVLNLLKLYRGICAAPMSLDEVIEQVDLADFLKTKIAKLSGGQFQKVRLALALIANPKLIVLDEPTVGIDVEGRHRFWATMANFANTGRTIIFTTHYLDEADEFAKRIIVMQKGKVITDGTGSQIKQEVTGRVISFSTETIRNWQDLPGVVSVAKTNSRISLRSSRSDDTLRTLITFSDIHDIEIATTTLEEAFIELTNRV